MMSTGRKVRNSLSSWRFIGSENVGTCGFEATICAMSALPICIGGRGATVCAAAAAATAIVADRLLGGRPRRRLTGSAAATPAVADARVSSRSLSSLRRRLCPAKDCHGTPLALPQLPA